MKRHLVRTASLIALTVAACAAPEAGDEDVAASTDELGHGPRWKVLPVDYQVQQTGYWCGPAATRVAISARRRAPSQGDLARELGTTTRGTDWIGQVTNVLNRHFGAGTYVTREMPNDPPTPAQRGRLWDDVVRSVDAGFAIVANIVAPAHNHPPGYPAYTVWHYFAVIGYNPDTRQVYIADSANFSGRKLYWLSFDQLATLIPPKGYSVPAPGRTGTACPGAAGVTTGAIDAKYRALGGCGSVLGRPITDERGTPDRVGRYNVFERGSIYWTPQLGAHEVHGVIRDAWRDLGWEAGVLGYPITDEVETPDRRGRYNVFERGSVYWTEETGAHAVLGRIRDEWKARGWERGPLGYPTSGEIAVPGGRRSAFQRGSITWRAATDDFEVVIEE